MFNLKIDASLYFNYIHSFYYSFKTLKHMKKGILLPVLLAAAVCLVALTGCQEPPAPPTEDCNNCKTYPAGSFEGIPAGLAFRMIRHYKEKNWDVMHAVNQKKHDARSVWFSLDSLKKFIYDLEQRVCSRNCKGEDSLNLGLRFYYAEYPDEKEWANLDPNNSDLTHRQEYENLHTVVVAPTYHNMKYNLNVDFDPRFFTTDNNGCKPASMQDVFETLGVSQQVMFDSINGPVATMPAFMLSPDCKTTAKNKGSLIPPPPFQTTNQGTVKGNGAVVFDIMEGLPLPVY